MRSAESSKSSRSSCHWVWARSSKRAIGASSGGDSIGECAAVGPVAPWQQRLALTEPVGRVPPHSAALVGGEYLYSRWRVCQSARPGSAATVGQGRVSRGFGGGEGWSFGRLGHEPEARAVAVSRAGLNKTSPQAVEACGVGQAATVQTGAACEDRDAEAEVLTHSTVISQSFPKQTGLLRSHDFRCQHPQ